MFEDIRFFKEEEVASTLRVDRKHPYMKVIMAFAFPNKTDEEKNAILDSVTSIHEFQKKVTYHAVKKIIEGKSKGFSVSGLENLQPDQAYLFVSNHRDILMDTCLLNYALFEDNQIMTASAIGDNLVTVPFIKNLSKFNRNFLIKRGLSPRELLQSSQITSRYIGSLLFDDNQSVWIAQREGRAKDGNDRTMPGVLKMLSMVDRKKPMDYLSKCKIVPVAVSYEYDPTDIRKVKELTAKELGMEYIKTSSEDFESIIWGATGQKGKMHISFGQPMSEGFDKLKELPIINEQFTRLAQKMDVEIHQLYQLHSSNWIAYDVLNGNESNQGAKYTPMEKEYFLNRMKKRQEKFQATNTFLFLKIYAYPVYNQLREEPK